MSSQGKNKDVVRLRTFAEDLERAKEAKSREEAGVPNVTNVAPLTTVTEHKTEKEEGQISVPKHSKDKVSPKTAAEKNPEPVPVSEDIFYNADNEIVSDTTYEETLEQKKADAKEADMLNVPIAQEITETIENPKKSILSDSDGGIEHTHHTPDIHGGTIIRDTKRKRFQLLPAIGAAIIGWFTKHKESYEQSREEKFKVAKAHTRVETIKAAAQKNMQAPDEDYTQVAERLKKTKRQKVETTIPIKAKEEVAAPQWTSAAEPAHETKDIENLNDAVSITKEKVNPEAATPDVIPKKEPPAYETPPVVAKNTSSTAQPVPITIETASAPKTESAKITRVSPVAKESVPIAESVPKPSQSTTHKRRPKIQKGEFPIIMLIVVAMLAVILGVGTTIVLFNAKQSQEKSIVVFRVPSLLFTESQISIPFLPQSTPMFESTLQILETHKETIQIYPTTQATEGERPEPGKNVMEVVAPNAPAGFLRAITEMTFGGVKGNPFIVLKVTNFDIGFAGMLQWERTMSSDLAPLFGEVVTETFDPSARTDTQVREAFFKDTVTANHSARVLLDAQAEERIIYSFVDKNTIVITTTKDAFEALTPQIR